MRTIVLPLSIILLCSLLWLTVQASLVENVFIGGARVVEHLWGLATLLDAYFAFVWCYLVIFYRERTTLSRLGWFIFVMTCGSMAVSLYLLLYVVNNYKVASLNHFFQPKTQV